MTTKEKQTTFENNAKVAERSHDKGLDYCYVHHDHDSALNELRKAISLREALYGKFHNDTALSYFRLASILVEGKKENFEALAISRREFRITQRLLGNSAFSLASSDEAWLVERKNWIIDVLSQESKRVVSQEETSKYWTQLLRATEFETIGDGHVGSGNWELAITQYNCALALESAAYARNVIDMADLHVKIGDCLIKILDQESALEEFKSAERIYKEEFGTLHTAVAIVYSKAASAHLQMHDFDSALASYSKAYTIYEHFFGREHEVCVEALKDIRLVAVKEIEYLRVLERRRQRAHGAKQKQREIECDLSTIRRRGPGAPARDTI